MNQQQILGRVEAGIFHQEEWSEMENQQVSHRTFTEEILWFCRRFNRHHWVLVKETIGPGCNKILRKKKWLKTLSKKRSQSKQKIYKNKKSSFHLKMMMW